MEKIIHSPYADIEIPENVSFPEYMLGKFRSFGDQNALICAVTNKTLTFKEVVDITERLITGLHKLGLRQYDVLAACVTNCVEYLSLCIAVTSLGAIFTTTNPIYTEDEILHHFDKCKVKYVVTNNESREKVLAVKRRCDSIKDVINIGTSSIATKNFSLLTKTNEINNIRLPKVIPRKDVAFYLSSSGTTGLPKAVMLTHYNIVANLMQTSDFVSKCGRFKSHTPKRNEPFISLFPYFHIGGLVYAGLNSMKQGAITVVLPKFESKPFLQSIEKYKPTLIIVPPPILVFLTKSPAAKNADLSSIKTIQCGAAPIGHELTELTCGYGMTELSPMTHQMPIGEISKSKHGSCGVIAPNTMCKIIDMETGELLGPNQTGEICSKGPQVMKGYLGNLRATMDMIDNDGFVHTGDIGYYDDDNFFFIVDRVKELIKVKAFQNVQQQFVLPTVDYNIELQAVIYFHVAPAELENILLSHPEIADVAVVGIPNEYAGELPRAYVVREPGSKLSEEDVKNFVAENVVAYKRLEGGVKFVDVIPKSSSGKILRRIIKQQIVNENKSSKL